MATRPSVPKGPSNQTKMGARPGTQQRAQMNLATGGGFNPNMPVGAQLAKQAASSYQQSLVPGGATQTGLGVTGTPLPAPVTSPPKTLQGPGAKPAQKQPTQRPTVTQGAADPTKGYNIFAGMTPEEIMQNNKSLGMSNLFKGSRPEEEPQSLLLMQTTGEEEPASSGGLPENWDEMTPQEKYSWLLQNAMGEIEGAAQEEEEETYEAQDFEIGGDTPDVTAAAEGKVGTFGVDFEGMANEGPGTVSDYAGVNDDLGGQNVESIEDAIQQWQSESASDVVGLDPEKKAAAMNQLDQKYASFLQQTLMGLDRQAAMAGTFGSAAHTMNINAAVSSAMQQMASEFMELEKMDLAAVEQDYSEMFTEMQGVADQYAKIEQLGMSLEGLEQAAYKMGLDKFSQEIQAYLATGEMGSKALQQYQKEIDQLIQMGALDLDAWKAGVSAEEAEAQLEMASANLALEYEKQVLAMAEFYGEKLAGEMTGMIDWIKENLGGYEEASAMKYLMTLFSTLQGKLAAGGDYDSAMDEFYEELANFWGGIVGGVTVTGE